MTPEFRPRRLKEYSVPEKFKPEIDRQIEELLRLGLICESSSPQAPPIVSICKDRYGSRGLHLAVDSPYVNNYTEADVLRPPEMHCDMQQFSSARCRTSYSASRKPAMAAPDCLSRLGPDLNWGTTSA